MNSRARIYMATTSTATCAKCARVMERVAICKDCGLCKFCSPRIGLVQSPAGLTGLCAQCVRADKRYARCEKCARVGPMLWPCHCAACCAITPNAHLVCVQCKKCEKCSARIYGSSYCVPCRDAIFADIQLSNALRALPIPVPDPLRTICTRSARYYEPLACQSSRLAPYTRKVQEKKVTISAVAEKETS